MASGHMIPEHLGGHYNRCHTDDGVLHYLVKKFELESMIDVGCGIGCMVGLAQGLGLSAMGIDGDGSVERNVPMLIHDFRESPPPLGKVDLIWSVEFVEHVEEEYMDNYMDAFKAGKYICMTHAPPKSKGHHHVNCQPVEYWIDKMESYGFTFLPKETKEIRVRSTMERDFIRRHGLMFSG